MKKISILIVAIVIVALAVFVAVGIDGNNAEAYSSGWDGGCGGCHTTSAGTGLHVAASYPTHAAGPCTVCHAETGDTPALAKCVVCHGSATVIAAANQSHVGTGCGNTGCHPASTTTTVSASTTTTASQATTTTAGQATTTTAGGPTTTAGGPTTTKAPTTTTVTVPTTGTTAQPTTTTTVPTQQPTFTG